MDIGRKFVLTLIAGTFISIVGNSDAAYAQLLGARQEYVQESSKTIALPDAGLIHAATPDGEISVVAWDRDEVSLVITKRIRTRRGASSAEARFDDMKVDISTTGSGLRIVGDVPNSSLGYGYSIDYEMRVPAGVDLELRTSDGEVRVTGVNGKVYARTSDGDIAVKDIGEAELRSSDGDIRADEIEGDISAVTSDGDIRVANVTGDASLRSSDGDIDCRDIGGRVEIQLSDGDVMVDAVHGGIFARSSDGELEVRNAAGTVELKTSDGNIVLSMSKTAPMSSVTCTSSDGNIRVRLNESAAFSIEARTSDGRVTVGFPGEFERDKKGRRISGDVNGGGRQVTLRTSDGSITVEAT